jgi:fibronectin-binding autotransporter adhesin
MTIYQISGSYGEINLYPGGAFGDPLTVMSTGVVSGDEFGVYASSVWTIANAGTVSGGSIGVVLQNGGLVTNEASGTITGDAGVSLAGAAGRVRNSGEVYGRSIGIYLGLGGVVTNYRGGAISGPQGVVTRNAAATIINYGSIGGQLGVYLVAGGSLTNGADAEIAGAQIAVATTGKIGTTVTNFGVIEGGSGVAVNFASAYDRLIAEAGSTCIGAVQGGGGMLEWAGGAETITGLGVSGSAYGADAVTFSGFGSYVIGPGCSGTLTGTNTLSNDQRLTVEGSFEVAGTLASSSTALYLFASSSLRILPYTSVVATDYGISSLNSGNQIYNAEMINGDYRGIYLFIGGSITNKSGGIITGAQGVISRNAAAIIENYGSISGHFAVYLLGGGTVTNASGGTIAADAAGSTPNYAIIAERNAATVINSGLIGSGEDGVELAAGGSVINELGGTITGNTVAQNDGMGAFGGCAVDIP